MLLLADKWKDYELIDLGGGEKLERWGQYVLRRPDPQVIWPIANERGLWKRTHMATTTGQIGAVEAGK